MRTPGLTFVKEHIPAAGSVCPMFDFTDPINRGVSRFLQKTLSMVLTSTGSPTLVPVGSVVLIKDIGGFMNILPVA